MPTLKLESVALRGLQSVLPSKVETLDEMISRFGEKEALKISEATGIRNRHILSPGQTILDLSVEAATKTLTALDWSKDSLDAIVVVTQTPDHPLPGNACLLQHRLGLSKSTAALDINLGCSGFVYGLWALGSMIKAGSLRRGLLVVGDASSHFTAPDDRTVRPLFGDAVSVAALELDEVASPMVFDLGTDGAGAPYLMVEDGALKKPSDQPRLFMDGTQVFVFTLREVPASINRTLDAAGWAIEDVDHVVLHQANRMMIEKLGQKLKIPKEKLIISMTDCGNTSSASIPLAMTNELSLTKPTKLLLSGFGVGWSWASVACEVDQLTVCETIHR